MPLCRYCKSPLIVPSWVTCDKKECRKERLRLWGVRKGKRKQDITKVIIK